MAVESKLPFQKGVMVNLVTKSSEHKVRVSEVEPLSVQVLPAELKSLSASIKTTNNAIITMEKLGYTYLVRIMEVTPQGKVSVEVVDRYEKRESFRVNVTVSISYEIIHKAPSTRIKKDDEIEKIRLILEKKEASSLEKTLAAKVDSLYEEVLVLRKRLAEKGETDPGKTVSREISLSESGLRFGTDVEHDTGDKLRISLLFENSKKPITVGAGVVRVDQVPTVGGRSSIACVFDEMKSSARETIVRSIFEVQRQVMLKGKKLEA